MTEVTDRHLARWKWQQEALERSEGKCGNCASTLRVSVIPALPFEAGGQLSAGNALVLCGACRSAHRLRPPAVEADRVVVNFWVSRVLYERLEKVVLARKVPSVTVLVRYVMASYLDAPQIFGDWQLYKDGVEERGGVRVNVLVARKIRGDLNAAALAADADAAVLLRALLLIYLETTEALS